MNRNKYFHDDSLAYEKTENYNIYNSIDEPKINTKKTDYMSDYMLDSLKNKTAIKEQNKEIEMFQAKPILRSIQKPMSFEEFVKFQKINNSIQTIENRQEEISKTKVLEKPSKKEMKKAENAVARSKRRALVIFFGLLTTLILILCLTAFVLFRYIFIAKYININGLLSYTDQEFLNIAGIERNMSLLAIDVDRVVKNVDTRADLKITNFSFVYPNGIYIRVVEKTPVAYTSSKGVIYYLDKYGDVIKKETELSKNTNLIELRHCIIEEKNSSNPEVKNKYQKDVYVEIMHILESLSRTDRFNSISISDGNIYMTTKDNFGVNLGDVIDMDKKIINALDVKDYMIQRNKTKGRIDVSIANKPVFSEEDLKKIYDNKYELDMSPSVLYPTIEAQEKILNSNKVEENSVENDYQESDNLDLDSLELERSNTSNNKH